MPKLRCQRENTPIGKRQRKEQNEARHATMTTTNERPEKEDAVGKTKKG